MHATGGLCALKWYSAHKQTAAMSRDGLLLAAQLLDNGVHYARVGERRQIPERVSLSGRAFAAAAVQLGTALK
jgi:hypothetical protein